MSISTFDAMPISLEETYNLLWSIPKKDALGNFYVKHAFPVTMERVILQKYFSEPLVLIHLPTNIEIYWGRAGPSSTTIGSIVHRKEETIEPRIYVRTA